MCRVHSCLCCCFVLSPRTSYLSLQQHRTSVNGQSCLSHGNCTNIIVNAQYFPRARTINNTTTKTKIFTACFGSRLFRETVDGVHQELRHDGHEERDDRQARYGGDHLEAGLVILDVREQVRVRLELTVSYARRNIQERSNRGGRQTSSAATKGRAGAGVGV